MENVAVAVCGELGVAGDQDQNMVAVFGDEGQLGTGNDGMMVERSAGNAAGENGLGLVLNGFKIDGHLRNFTGHSGYPPKFVLYMGLLNDEIISYTIS